MIVDREIVISNDFVLGRKQNNVDSINKVLITLSFKNPSHFRLFPSHLAVLVVNH